MSEHLTRSFLLEIAEQESEEAQTAMWQAALAGGLTVKSTRRGKDRTEPTEKSIRTTIPFLTKSASTASVSDE